MNQLLLALALLATPAHAHADDDFSQVTIKATPLAPQIFMLEGAGGNITALIGSDGTLLVDDDFAPMAEKLVDKLKELKGASPRFIVNTHFHYDHSGGNEVFGPTATIIAATQARTRLMSEQVLWKEKHPAEPPRAWPTLTYDEELALHVNGEDVRVVHLPRGHTDGDSVVFFQNGKVASLGDLYFSGMYPIFHPEHDGSLEGYLQNIETLLKQLPDDARIVPGHGPLSTKAELIRFHQMIQASVATVKKAKRRGQSLLQVQKAGLPKEWESFGHGYLTTDRWLALVYANVKP